MSGTKTCPLCGIVRWVLDGKVVLETQDLADFKLHGYSIKELLDAIQYAKTRGWKAQEERGR